MLLLSACATLPPGGEDGLLRLPGEIAREPDDVAVRVAVHEYLAQKGAPRFSLYDVHRVDLDGDRRRDALVLFKNPYRYWCDVNGCPMLVLRANEDAFEFVNDVTPVRGPVYISSEIHNGWNNIMMRVSGRWSETKDVALVYDGETYPSSPETLPSYDRLAQTVASKIFR